MKLSIRRKILLTYAISVAIGALIWISSYYYHNDVTEQLQLIEEKDYIFNDILEARRYEKNFFLTENKGHLDQALYHISRALPRLRDLITLQQEHSVSQGLPEWLLDIQAYEGSLLTLRATEQVSAPSRHSQGLRDDLKVLCTELQLLGHKMTDKIEESVNIEHKYVQSLISKSKIYHFATLAALLALASLTAMFLLTDVNRPLKYIEAAIRKITRGDYTIMPEISTGDEFQSLVTSLNDMIHELNRRNDQILQAEKLTSLGTLTSGVAHELNNPLNNISTSVQIILEELEEDNLEFKKEMLAETLKQVDRARDTVKALLEFSREGAYSPKDVNFKELLDKTIKLVRSEVPANVEIIIEMADDLTVFVCPNRIQQVLIILILNAIQAMEDAGGKVTIRATVQAEHSNFIIEVSDTGPGIPEAIIPKIFDPFFTTKDVGKGSGLGLSIAHGIVEQHCGRIEIDSAPDQGTTFTIILPA